MLLVFFKTIQYAAVMLMRPKKYRFVYSAHYLVFVD